MAEKATQAAGEFEIPVEGFKGTPEEIEQQWFDQVYRGRGDTMPQLTVRAVVMGIFLGGVLSLTNLYIGLKAGWGFGVAITACILSYIIWTGFWKAGIAKTQMSILENNCMQSTASSAGYSTGSTLVSAFAAYVMITQQQLPLGLMLGWTFFTGVLGVTMAIPMKRQMINIEQLRFPSGIAAAETLRALHAEGSKAIRSAKGLTYAAILAAVDQFWREGLRLISPKLEPYSLNTFISKANDHLFGKTWISRTVLFTWDPIFVAAGAISGMRVGLSMFVGGTLCWCVFVPMLQARGIAPAAGGYRDLVQWTLWGGTSCMVTAGLVSFFAQWRMIAEALRGLKQIFGGSRSQNDERARIESPMSWFAWGQIVSLIGLAILGKIYFKMPVWQIVIAVALTFFLALVACRVTGETDTTPIGAMGKITQLLFGAISPGNMTTNLIGASITGNAAIASADLLTDLKSGYLLGANPRKQFLAQFSGLFLGTIASVMAFRLLVTNPSILGSDQFPAPAAQAWKGVAIALSQGLSSLGPIKTWSMAIGGAVGIVFALAGILFPRHQKYIPSAGAFGLAWTFHWYYSLLFFLGAIVGLAFQKASPRNASDLTYPIASGVIAGGALMGVLLIFWENGPAIAKSLFGH
jgi:putative OPT family oligopeptide transporter